jgi:hypothetical protein
MTDDELQSQYAGYSDKQLVEYIANGIPDWQAEQFRRLLMLRRRAHYLRHVDTTRIPDPNEPARPPELPRQAPPPNRNKPKGNEPEGKKSKGCGCLILLIFAIILFIIFASSISQY